MNNLKELLNSCDFGYLPMFTAFTKDVWKCLSKNAEAYEYNTGQLIRVHEYREFITQPLSLSMFVPVSEEGEVLEEPIQWYNWLDFQRVKETGELTMHPFTTTDMEECEAYKQAQYRVIFECNEKQKRLTLDIIIKQFNTIEHAVNDGLKLKLIK